MAIRPTFDVRATRFDGLSAFELSTERAKLVVVTEKGPRIAHFGARNGRNLLFWDRTGKHRRGRWSLMGGHRLWVTRPGADEAEETYFPDAKKCRVARIDRGLAVSAPPDPLGIAKTISIQAESPSRFSILHQLKNESDMLWSGGAWGLTCTLPGKGTTYGVPLGDGSDWDVFSIVTPKRWAGHASKVNDPQLILTEDCLVVCPRGTECKRMIQAPEGRIGMTDPEEGLTFLKQSKYLNGSAYPLGCNVAFYVGPESFMVEMETMGPIEQVRPGRTLAHQEVWTLEKPIDWASYPQGAPR